MSDKKNKASGTMDLSNLDWNAIRQGEATPFQETQSAPTSRAGTPADGSLPFGAGAQTTPTHKPVPVAQNAEESTAPVQALKVASPWAQPGGAPASAPHAPVQPRPSQPPAPQPGRRQPPPQRQRVAPAPAATRPAPIAAPPIQPRPGAPRVGPRPPDPLRQGAPAITATPKPAPKEKAAPVVAKSQPLALLWAKPGAGLRLRRTKRFTSIFEAMEARPVDYALDDADPGADPETAEDRREVFEVLARAAGVGGDGLRDAVKDAIRDDGKFVAPLVIVSAELEAPPRAQDRLEATLKTVAPFVMPPADKEADPPALNAAVAQAKAYLQDADKLSPDSAFDAFTKRVVRAFEAEEREVGEGFLQKETDRALLQARSYQRRTIFGDEHLRTLLHLDGAPTPVPTYLPADLAAGLPLYRRFEVRLVCEGHRREDVNEESSLALLALAVARILPRD